MFYDRFTRLLHLLFAFGIVAQLLISNIMEEPDDGEPGNFFYGIHEKLGVALLIVLALHWLWVLVRGGHLAFGHLFPWMSAARRGELYRDTRHYLGAVMTLSLPPADEPSPLAGAIHGLGLLIATGLAASGLVIFLFAPETGELRGLLHLIAEVHETLGPLMWTYLVIHVGAAVFHEILGHRILHSMFSVFKKNPDS